MSPRACSQCAAAGARLYICGWRCTRCAPPAPPTPDPARTAAALRARYERLVIRGGRR